MAAHVTRTMQRDRGRAEHQIETDDGQLYLLHTIPYHDRAGAIVGWKIWFADNQLLQTDQEGAVAESLVLVEQLRRRRTAPC